MKEIIKKDNLWNKLNIEEVEDKKNFMFVAAAVIVAIVLAKQKLL